MIRYKINVYDALQRRGFNMYQAQKTKLLSTDTMKKLREEDTRITLASLNIVCQLLDMQPKDLIEYVPDL
jgi:putative transcriptional regulator